MYKVGTSSAIRTAMEGITAYRGRRIVNRSSFHWAAALLLVSSLLGCGGLVSSSSPQSPPSNVTVSISPVSASVLLGEPQTFAATVSNSTNTVVAWSVNGIPGGNSTVGTVSATGLYTSPGDLPLPASVTVQATSAADSTKSASASVTIFSDVNVSVTPQTMPVELGATRAFAASVNSAGNPDKNVTWIVSGNG